MCIVFPISISLIDVNKEVTESRVASDKVEVITSLCLSWPRICFICHCHNVVLSSFV